jgi:hypothetical protein
VKVAEALPRRDIPELERQLHATHSNTFQASFNDSRTQF